MLESLWGLGALAPALAVAPLVARLGERELSPKQQLILRVVKQRPGIGTTELASLVDLGWGSFYGHLKVLERRKLVVIRKGGKFRAIYPKGVPMPRRILPPERLGAKARPIAMYLVKHPGLDMADYLERLPVSRRTAYYHIQRFVREGLFTSQEDRRYVGLQPTGKVLKLLGIARK